MHLDSDAAVYLHLPSLPCAMVGALPRLTVGQGNMEQTIITVQDPRQDLGISKLFVKIIHFSIYQREKQKQILMSGVGAHQV